MKKALRILMYIVLLLVVVGGIAAAYFNSKFPVDLPVENIKVEATPERLQRGQYLVEHVTLCIDCHSERDWSKYSAPVIPNTLGMGGEEFTHDNVGLPGTLYAKNITPAGISKYTDGELYRVITTGITRENQALFPLMPYMRYRELAKEDIYSIITYIRSLKPIEHEVKERSLDFPMNFIVNTIPMEAAVVNEIPPKSDTLAYGKYMVNAAACIECHTQLDEKGQYVPGMLYAGGFRFKLPNGDEAFSANITPDVETGIGALNRETFIAKFKAFDNEQSKSIPVTDHTKNTIMPWTQYAGMDEDDLAAIYAYLRTIEPVKNKVVTFRPIKVNL